MPNPNEGEPGPDGLSIPAFAGVTESGSAHRKADLPPSCYFLSTSTAPVDMGCTLR